LEGFEDVTEIEAFVRGYGTGAKIPGMSSALPLQMMCVLQESADTDVHPGQTRRCSLITLEDRHITTTRPLELPISKGRLIDQACPYLRVP
jgi:hypothetical protein